MKRNRLIPLGLLRLRAWVGDPRGVRETEAWARATGAQAERERRRRWIEACRERKTPDNVLQFGGSR